jgi:hypothetical protein
MAENVEEICGLISEDHRQTIHELADAVGISYGVCQEILTENFEYVPHCSFITTMCLSTHP